ncbi:MAG TPA: ATP-binding cassette domain-containing protein [Solirubrobacteraceae bacterium]|jgi:putative ABC transport system ATP-binding protein|nr:ATP-binding cassette domain-containing protein [Solirubrobacteraceae bacterium]
MSPANSGPGHSAELLKFEEVTSRRPDGHRHLVVLKDASFSIEPGTFAGIYGARRSGKSTLLRLAAGIELPEGGLVRIDGRDTSSMSMLERERLLRDEVGIVSIDDWHPKPRESLLDYVALALGSEGATLRQARHGARRALQRIGLADSAGELAVNLSVGERLRAMLARALVREPRLLLVDEPAAIPRISDREDMVACLRRAAGEIGATLLVASEEMGPLHGADLVISVGGGEINITVPRRGTVVPFPSGRGPGGKSGQGSVASDGEARSS